MKYFVFSLLLSFCLCTHVQGQPQRLSDQAKISLLTVDPGAELYSTFGHSSIRVQDPVQNFDWVFNWGTFDFNTPNFYLKFMRGKLLYYLNPEPYRNFEYGNMVEERTMIETPLSFSGEERAEFYTLLRKNLEKENRGYKYDFFEDNCATRIRDMVAQTYGYQITWDSSLYHSGPRTMRQLLQPYMEDRVWAWFGMQLVLGVPTDRQATLEGYMFLPDHLRTIFLNSRTPSGKALSMEESQIPEGGFQQPKLQSGFLTSPFFVLSMVAILGLFSMGNARIARVFDTVFSLVLGLLGLLFALLWFATDHSPTVQNMNLLWALPTHLLVFWRSRKTSWVDVYFIGTGILAALFLVFYKWLPQGVPTAILPIVALVLIKGVWGRRSESQVV